MSWRIIEGDCRDRLATLPERSVQCCVTSPPYFGLRSYTDGDLKASEIGTEPTPDEFVAALVETFRGVRRVLRDDGTVWCNLGDSYAANRSYQVSDGKHLAHDFGASNATVCPPGCKPKDLIGIPWMVAFALRADGWYLRSDIIWAKLNPMPESVTDRPTKSHEYLFLLTKGPRYFYDADAVREDGESFGRQGSLRHRQDGLDRKWQGVPQDRYDVPGRNKRSVWTVATQPYAGAHFATFPPKLIEPCILAGSAPKACGVCGTPWRRVTERFRHNGFGEPVTTRYAPDALERREGGLSGLDAAKAHRTDVSTIGWESGCDHNDDTGTCTILDPFNGAGTTGLVALRHDRSYIGIELNPEYAEMARWRLRDDAPLLNTGLEDAA